MTEKDTLQEQRSLLLAETGLTLPKNFNSLLSFHKVPNPEEMKMVQGWGFRLVGDSGAYSVASIGATIDIDQYSEWVKELQGVLCWAASLDVIGDPKGSYKNFIYMRNKGLDVIPTVHYPTSPTVISDYVKLGCDFIGLGGMVPRNDPVNLKRWLVSVFLYAKKHHPEVRFHGWGCSSQTNVKDLPFWSVDSSTFSGAHRWGQLHVIDDVSLERWKIALDGVEPYKNADLLKRLTSLNAKDIERSIPDNKHLILYAVAKASINLETFLRKRFGPIEAPRYGNDHAPGIHVHNVLTPWDMRVLRRILR